MAAVRLSRGLAPGMIRRGKGGVILNNASICAAQPLWYEPIYNVTKAALVMFSKNLANELIPHGIRVNALNLGLVLTPDWVRTATKLTEGTGRGWQDYIQGIADEHAPIKRFAKPEEVAELLRVPVLRQGELQRRLDLLCRRRDAADGGVSDPAPFVGPSIRGILSCSITPAR
jgi:NAD(P)-dependent dehydrogenase (short-subunit alcohol dehydrogenase family)